MSAMWPGFVQIREDIESPQFDFSNWGIALKLDVYPDKFILSSFGGLFIQKRAIELKKIAKIFKDKQI